MFLQLLLREPLTMLTLCPPLCVQSHNQTKLVRKLVLGAVNIEQRFPTRCLQAPETSKLLLQRPLKDSFM